LRGEKNVVLVSGSDEHGTPIEVEALSRGISPRKLTDEYHQVFVNSLKAFDINFNNYSRTESRVHKKFVRDFYVRLDKNGYVFIQNVILPYCEIDKRFLPDRFVEGECPHCHYSGARGDQCDNCGRILEPKDLIKPYCVICHSAPVFRESRHWFFDLPRLRAELENYIRGNVNFPENARNFSIAWLREGLKPRSLTRDNKWGIQAPFKGAEHKTLYVWMEAVLGYLSATKEWAEKKHTPSIWKKYWHNAESRNIHFVGKDNIPFHTVIFPGLLLAVKEGYSLPWQVSSTEYLQFNGEKFSKSRKVGVWIDEALKLEQAEYWRFILVSLRPEQKDANFTWEEFERKINNDLNDVIGNFVHRTITFLIARFDSKVPEFDVRAESDQEILEIRKLTVRKVLEDFETFRLKDALEQIVQLSRAGNRYLNQREPWQTIKTDREAAGQSLAIAIQLVATIGILLGPFLPDTSRKILNSLFRTKKPPSWSLLLEQPVVLKSGTTVNHLSPLFHKVSAEDLRSKLVSLRAGKIIEVQT
jgi:methionyl-tRNA synthetase